MAPRFDDHYISNIINYPHSNKFQQKFLCTHFREDNIHSWTWTDKFPILSCANSMKNWEEMSASTTKFWLKFSYSRLGEN